MIILAVITVMMTVFMLAEILVSQHLLLKPADPSSSRSQISAFCILAVAHKGIINAQSKTIGLDIHLLHAL